MAQFDSSRRWIRTLIVRANFLPGRFDLLSGRWQLALGWWYVKCLASLAGLLLRSTRT